MKSMPFHLGTSVAFSIAAVLLVGLSAQTLAQGMHHEPSVPSIKLTIQGLDGKSLDLTPEEFAALPHKAVSVFNSHTKANESYSGVALSDLLAKVGVPQGENVKGRMFLIGVTAEGTDKYSVLYALAEIDPSIHTGDVIVADAMDGKKLATDGAFKLISTEERRPARWVRNLAKITAVQLNP